MTPQQEVASFRIVRGDCLWENGRFAEALREYAWAIGFAPYDPRYQRLILDSYRKYRAIMDTKSPPTSRYWRCRETEEIELQRGIVRWHRGCWPEVIRLQFGRLRNSRDRDAIGRAGKSIHRTPTASRSAIRPVDARPRELLDSLPSNGRSVRLTGARRKHLEAMERAQQQTKINLTRQRLQRPFIDRATQARFGRIERTAVMYANMQGRFLSRSDARRWRGCIV